MLCFNIVRHGQNDVSAYVPEEDPLMPSLKPVEEPLYQGS